MSRVLLDTVHGSRLYGLAHAGSDYDRYIVVSERPGGKGAGNKPYRWANHDNAGSSDVVTVDLHTFLDMASKGVPQALEAMFAPAPDVDLIAPLRAGFRAVGPEVMGTYCRTIKSFALAGEPKRRRHALRLSRNLRELMHSGRFDPRLDVDTAALMTAASLLATDEFLYVLSAATPVEIDFEQ